MLKLTCWFSALVFLTLVQPTRAAGPHFVFAHYMVCYADYGDSVAGFEHDIQDAQAAGLDGFALNVGQWTNSGGAAYYPLRVAMLYQAAAQLGTGFKFFFSVDDQNTNDIVAMISAYANNTNSFRYQGRLVVSTYTDMSVDWQNSVLKPLTNLGINVFFVPNFLPANNNASDEAGLSNVLATCPYVDGLFNFAVYTVADITNSNQAFSLACRAAGKLFMAGYSPTYWGDAQTGASGRGYCETAGGEGTIAEWQWIIANQPDWVEIVTWNDFNESTYTSPIVNPMQYESGFQPPFRYCHAGYLALSQYYITWYKTGQPPAINQDAFYYFYRTHSTNAVALDTNDQPITLWPNNGPVQDDLYTTAFMTSPAQLVIASGNTLTTNSLPAGISSLRTPFALGAQVFTFQRSNSPPISVHGPDVLAQITNYNYFTASGSVFRPGSPANLQIIH